MNKIIGMVFEQKFSEGIRSNLLKVIDTKETHKWNKMNFHNCYVVVKLNKKTGKEYPSTKSVWCSKIIETLHKNGSYNKDFCLNKVS